MDQSIVLLVEVREMGLVFWAVMLFGLSKILA